MSLGFFLEVIEARRDAPAEIRPSVAAGPGVPVLPPMENPAWLFFFVLFFAKEALIFILIFIFNLYFSSYCLLLLLLFWSLKASSLQSVLDSFLSAGKKELCSKSARGKINP